MPTRKPPSFNYNQCISAIQGKSVPDNLSSTTARCAVIRGIRCHYEFATSDAVSQTCTQYPDISRARNARLIMSNVIPENLEENPANIPYCTWAPDFALESTYRKLAELYPSMRYQVGRACAAAGYADLYAELDLLPDISIAEEARESGTDGGRKIYAAIMSAPVKYAVMDDFTRSVNTDTPRMPEFLNGDTAVRWTLENRDVPNEDGTDDNRLREPDIEEDHGLNDIKSELPESRQQLSHEEATLLWMPLPPDLPTIKKELLLRSAAYEGNIDRYARLMRPYSMTWIEMLCVVRGIYHHTMFARWWDEQLNTNIDRVRSTQWDSWEMEARIKRAINARRVMINEITGFNDDTPYLPYLIWWPRRPQQAVLYELLQRCPKMKQQITAAAIHCNYQRLYERIDVEPHWHLWMAAKESHNPRYLADILRRASEKGINVTHGRRDWDGTSDVLDGDLEPTGDIIVSPLHPDMMGDTGNEWGTYFGQIPESSAVERYVWETPEHLMKLEEEWSGVSTHGTLEFLDEESSDEEEEDASEEGERFSA